MAGFPTGWWLTAQAKGASAAQKFVQLNPQPEPGWMIVIAAGTMSPVEGLVGGDAFSTDVEQGESLRLQSLITHPSCPAAG
jgi:hypothetical protein